MKPFHPTRRPTREEIESATALDEYLITHKRLSPPPYNFGPRRAQYLGHSETSGVLFVPRYA